MGFRPKSVSTRGFVCLSTPSGVDASSSALRFLSAKLRRHRRELGTRWRRLSTGQQALLTLAHLRNGHPYSQLAAGFGIGTTTAYRYVTEAVEVLDAHAPTLTQAIRTASAKALVLLDGTLLTRASARASMTISRCRGHGPAPLLEPLGDSFRGPAGGQPVPREDTGPCRAGHRHPEVLAAPEQAPLLDHSAHQPGPEKWTLAADGSIRNVPAGLCLDVDGAATVNRSALVLWTCNGQDNRRPACG
jgi:hypothetical protein